MVYRSHLLLVGITSLMLGLFGCRVRSSVQVTVLDGETGAPAPEALVVATGVRFMELLGPAPSRARTDGHGVAIVDVFGGRDTRVLIEHAGHRLAQFHLSWPPRPEAITTDEGQVTWHPTLAGKPGVVVTLARDETPTVVVTLDPTIRGLLVLQPVSIEQFPPDPQGLLVYETQAAPSGVVHVPALQQWFRVSFVGPGGERLGERNSSSYLGTVSKVDDTGPSGTQLYLAHAPGNWLEGLQLRDQFLTEVGGCARWDEDFWAIVQGALRLGGPPLRPDEIARLRQRYGPVSPGRSPTPTQ